MTPEVEKKRRELFEAWMSDQLRMDKYTPKEMRDEVFRIDPAYGQYESGRIQIGWAAFNASLDAVEIELPAEFDRRDVQGLDYDEVVAAITATGLGIRIK